MDTKKNNNKKLPMLSWLVFPLLGVWLATNYMIGLNRKVDWNNSQETRPKVLSLQTETKSQTEPLKWKGNGLITLWFDDAWYSQYSIAFPVLSDLGMTGALSVPTNQVSVDNYMSWPQIKRVQFKGWEIASHSVNHICTEEIADKKITEYEMGESLKILQQEGLSIENYVAPCGVANPDVITVAKRKYLSMRTSAEGLNKLPVDNPYLLKIHAIHSSTTIGGIENWINEAEKTNQWLILVFHQIGYKQNDYEMTPELFTETVKLIEKSDLTVALPSQALQVSMPIK